MKQLTEHIKLQQLSESKQTDKIKWQLLKFKICKFQSPISRTFSKMLQRKTMWITKKNKKPKSNINAEVNFNK